MKKTDFVKPDIGWLLTQFEYVPLGIVRPAEMEIILAYILMYHQDNDFEKNEYELAEKYRISETKALRLKTEFAKRWSKKDFANIVEVIGSKIFGEERSIELEIETNGGISFILTDPNELKALKRALEFNAFPYRGDFNGKLVHLTQDKFVGIFLKYYPPLQESLNESLAEHFKTQKERDRLYDKALPFDYKIKKLLQKIAPTAISVIETTAGIAIR